MITRGCLKKIIPEDISLFCPTKELNRGEYNWSLELRLGYAVQLSTQQDNKLTSCHCTTRCKRNSIAVLMIKFRKLPTTTPLPGLVIDNNIQQPELSNDFVISVTTCKSMYPSLLAVQKIAATKLSVVLLRHGKL